MDIEEVAHRTPEKIITEVIDPLAGLGEAQAKQIATAIGLPAGSHAQSARCRPYWLQRRSGGNGSTVTWKTRLIQPRSTRSCRVCPA